MLASVIGDNLQIAYLYPMSLPKKILSRKDEITAQFLQLTDQHMDDLLNGRAVELFHIRHFAAALFIHPVHLSNTIKLTTGRSPCDIIEEKIMNEAKRMLEETDMPVAEIGYTFTYSEPTNFIKFFKNMCGQTPLQYRKSLVRV